MYKTKLEYNSLDLIPVGMLLHQEQSEWLRFYVPAYQRGYRWSAEQVEQLIDDLIEFKTRKENNSQAFYCLQPLVVKPVNQDGIESLEVIDGQQRLTTILIILQVLRQLQYEEERDEDTQPYFSRLLKDAYDIKYETRSNSSEWLPKLSETLFSDEAFKKFDNQNCDYSHFAEVFKAAYNRLKGVDRSEFKTILTNHTYFIWYLPSEGDDNNVEIFDRLNAGKIGLNNAELVKALLLQSSNIPTLENYASQINMSDRDVIQKIALEWDNIERKLHDDSLWGFIYSEANQGLEYESRIEYLLDLQQGKTIKDKERYFYTFNAYLHSYRQMMKNGGFKNSSKRLEWVKVEWDNIKILFDLIMEWYENRHLYHRIGFILEYNPDYNLKRLESILPPLSQSKRIKTLDGIIIDIVKNISSKKLFYGNKELSEILFLYNILLEDRRYNDSARFSFADYKQVRKNTGWDQEHVASSQDHEPSESEQKELAIDLIELITGNKPKLIDINNKKSSDTQIKDTKQQMIYELVVAPDSLDANETELCGNLLSILNQNDNSRLENSELDKIYEAIFKHFNGHKDPLKDYFTSVQKREKDFIWNFVLLNAKTNRSYGNHIFPVKRRRILADEFKVYTPVGTRNVFEKAYSRKIEHFLAWTRTDAKAYWEDIKRVLTPYVQLTDIE